MKELLEFLEECKHNQEINEKNNLENRINLDYVIERLEDIVKEITEENKKTLKEIKK